ncbi:MAG: hypothetical protein LBU65_14065 [Planctomycetaceae bacterium]|jgi:hypothetical protein|nr:hypothetical protein [Planctomycetaceae bacterium]
MKTINYVVIGIVCLTLSAVGEELRFQGELGKSAELAVSRFFNPPLNSLAWLRADLTNENTDVQRRFKNYNGDVSGRYLELMAFISRGNKEFHPALKQFLNEIPSRQQKDGHFGYDEVDWTKPIDANGDKGRMLPLLWGNARFLCGLTKAYEVFRDPALLDCAKKLGDYYVLTADRFLDANQLHI